MRLRWTALMVLAVLTILTSSCSSSNGNTVAPGQPNPTPIITGLFPSSVTAGSQGFTLFIAGTGFIDGSTGTSTAFWNGSARSATVNINTGQIAITVLATDVASPGTSLITVSNPLPGGGISINAAPFTVFPTQTNTPLISSLSPATANPKAAAFTLTVNGSNFIAGNANNPATPNPTPPFSGSVVAFNGSPRTTAFVSSTQLTAQITSADILAAGCNGISVYTYTGGGNEIFSPTVSFLASSTAAPAICSLLPSSVVAGAAEFTITVSGASFATNSTVKWNNSARATTFVNANTVQAQITASDVAKTGVEPITVVNSGGGSTAPLNFSILPTPPITPAITAIAPANATAGGAAFTLTVTGTNFIQSSVVDWNGAARTTSFKSSTSLQAQIPATDLATPGTFEITVLNISSNGAAAFSNQFPFTVNAAAGAAVKFPQVVSVSLAGGPADGASEAPAISSGGRYVAFYSQAKNLIAPAAGAGNIFVRDTCMGAANCSPKTLPVDLAPDGSPPNGKSGRQVALSGDGRFVAFVSRATNLVPANSVVSLGYWELYVRDLCVGANAPSGCTPHTEIISLGAEGEAASGPSTSPSLSADGRFIAFVSAAGNLAAQKPASLPQAYLRDTCAGPTASKACVARTVPVPVDEEDRVAGAQAGRPAISADGRYVALEMWTAKSAGTSQIALADTCLGIDAPVDCEASAARISYAPDDSALSGANISPSLSADARFVVFESQPASSSTGNAAPLSKSYLRDTCLGATAPDGCVPSTTLLANDSTTTAAKTLNFSPAISASGRFISFVSGAAASAPAGQVASEGSLVVRDTCFGAVLPCTPHTSPVSEASAVFSPTHTALVVSSSNKSAPLAADRYSVAPLSADGRFATFYAPDTIAAQPASGIGDVYLTVTPF
jgi:WD40-like Beta Propeller Repeat